MATMQELEKALINADAAGDTEAAEVLANEIKRIRQGNQFAAAEQEQSRRQMTHPLPQRKPSDIYTETAKEQTFLQNLEAGAGGAMYGLGYLGPKSLAGKATPEEIEDWKASMSGLSNTAGGTIGQIAGYGTPAALAAPFIGASVPVAASVGAIEGLLLPAKTSGERAFNVVASAGGATLGQAGGNALARRMAERAASKTAEMTAKRSANATRDASLGMIREAGYKVTPSQTNAGLLPRTMEGISGKYKTEQAMRLKNQPLTNRAANAYLGLPENTALSDAALDAYRHTVAQPYRDVAALPKRIPVRAESNVTDWVPPVKGVKGFDPEEALKNLNRARLESKLQWKAQNMTGSVDAYDAAIAADDMVASLEDQIERYAIENGDEALVKKLRNARKMIAKAHTVERALNDTTGDVSAVELGKMLTKGVPINDDLLPAARLGQGFKEVAAVPKSGDATPITALDFLLGAGLGGGAALFNPAGLALAALPSATRIGARSTLMTRPVQRLLNPNYGIGLTNRMLPGLLGNPVSQAMYPGAGIYMYGVEPGLE